MKKRLSFWIFLLCVAFFAPQALALDIEVKMLAKDSALLQIDGKQRMLRKGATSPEGVLLVSADGKNAVIEINGKRQTLGLTRRISTHFSASEKAAVRISSSQGGHYVTLGRINGMPVDFMIDTGATIVAMNYLQAEALGIDYRAGKSIKVNTANGVAQAFEITLNSVSVGAVEIKQVRAAVSTTEFPRVILLGNSYLGKIDMRVDDGVLLLQAKH